MTWDVCRDLHFKESSGSFHQYRSADGQGALVEVELRMMEQVIFMSLLLGAKGEHRAGGMFHEFAEILGAQCLFDLKHVFRAEYVPAGCFNDLRHCLVVDHGRTPDLKP